MVDVYKYRVECTTDAKDEFVWRDENQGAPTLCPTNSAHTIGTVTRIDEIKRTSVSVIEEDTPTGGHFQALSITLDTIAAGPGVTTTKTVSYDVPVSGLAFSFVSEPNQKGDCICIAVGKDTVAGSITSDVDSGDTTFNVSQTVIDNSFIGIYVNLHDGVNTDDCGLVTAIDADNKTITVSTATTNAFAAATPTYVRLSVRIIHDYFIGPAWMYRVGDSKIGGSYLPAGTTITIEYINNTADADKTLYIDAERLY